MSIKKLDRAVDFLERLGLTDSDIKVYSILIDAPLLSVGEIQQSIGNMDLIHVLESIRDLNDIGLIRTIEGDLNRYYATLPFLQEAVTVERETVFALNSLITSIREKEEEINKRIETTEAITFPEAANKLLDEFTSRFYVPLKNDLRNVNETIDEIKIAALRNIDEKETALNKLQTEIAAHIREYLGLTELKLSETHEKLEAELAALQDEGNSTTEDEFQEIYKDLRVQILGLKKLLTQLISQAAEKIAATQPAIQQFNDKIMGIEKNVDVLAEFADDIQKFKENLQSALIITREEMKEQVNKETTDTYERDPVIITTEDGTQITRVEKIKTTTKGPEKADIDAAFDKLLQRISKITVESVESTKATVETIVTEGKAATVSVETMQSKLQDELAEQQKNSKKQFEKIAALLSSTMEKLHIDTLEKYAATHEHVAKTLNAFQSRIEENQQEVTTKYDEAYAMLESEQQDLFTEFKTAVDETLLAPYEFITTLEDLLKDITSEEKANYEERVERIIIDATTMMREAHDTNTKLLIERVNFAKSMLEGRGADLRAILKLSKSFKLKSPLQTSIVYGLPGIYATLTDLLLRARRKVTIVTPKIDTTIFDIARRNRSTIQTTIVTAIDAEKDKSLIKKAEQTGTIKLLSYTDEDLYACFRDDEEMVFGYSKAGEEMTAVRSTQDSIIELFKDRFNETIVRRAKRLN